MLQNGVTDNQVGTQNSDSFPVQTIVIEFVSSMLRHCMHAHECAQIISAMSMGISSICVW